MSAALDPSMGPFRIHPYLQHMPHVYTLCLKALAAHSQLHANLSDLGMFFPDHALPLQATRAEYSHQ